MTSSLFIDRGVRSHQVMYSTTKGPNYFLQPVVSLLEANSHCSNECSLQPLQTTVALGRLHNISTTAIYYTKGMELTNDPRRSFTVYSYSSLVNTVTVLPFIDGYNVRRISHIGQLTVSSSDCFTPFSSSAEFDFTPTSYITERGQAKVYRHVLNDVWN